MLMVFGSINMDISIPVPRLPRPGETMLGGPAVISPGGKGANQAHAAQRFGVATRLVGAVGDDAFASTALDALRLAGTDLQGVRYLPGCSTGLASISVARGGENCIVVAPGANALLRADWVDDAALAACNTLLLQLEAPAEESFALARRARQAGCRVLLNAAPWIDDVSLPPGLFDWLIVNEGELRSACLQLGLGGLAQDDAAAPAARLAAVLGCRVFLTLGADGALTADASGPCHRRRALRVNVLDTTGAGDTCAGVFAAALALGLPEPRALDHAVAAASLACTRRGAQAAQPTRSAIDAALIDHPLARS